MHLAAILLLLGTSCAASYEPTASYEIRHVEGWTVYVSGILRQHPQLADKVVGLLREKLDDIARVIPKPALGQIRNVRIWLEYQDRDIAGGTYHPSGDWLREHDFNPDKERCVEFGNAENFLRWSAEQPSMVLHELAHAYHHQVLGYNYPDIESAYRAALASHIYDSVLCFNGQKKRHYGMNNPKEYFAESTEAFFGRNDFYPFVRSELQQHDPRMYELVKAAWGVD